MAKKTSQQILRVQFDEIVVGYLSKQGDGSVYFRYSPEWLENGFPISHSLLLQEASYKGEAVNRYFDNLLPDNLDLREKIAEKFGAESVRSFDLLSVIGRDCVGALTFIPMEYELPSKRVMKYRPLSENDIASRLRNLSRVNPLGMGEEDFRISLAGNQEKTAFLNVNGQWQLPLGTTPSSHIFKSAIGALGADLDFWDSIDNEWASLKIMEKMGLPVCRAEIGVYEDQKVLIVERFDRIWKSLEGSDVLLRKPQEDMCQALGYSPYKKYQSDGGPGIQEIVKFLEQSKSVNDRLTFFKAILVNDLLYAPDGHAKNYSIFIESDGMRMTPFYDVMGGYFLHKRERRRLQSLKAAMKAGSSGYYSFHRISQRHYRETAVACGIHSAQFDEMLHELQAHYRRLSFSPRELDPQLNQDTLGIILEGMEKRAKVMFQ